MTNTFKPCPSDGLPPGARKSFRPNRARRLLDCVAAPAAYCYLSGVVFVLGTTFGWWFVAPGPHARGFRADVGDRLALLDGEWYASISESGYAYDPGSRSSIAFFPLYPLLAHCATRLLPVTTRASLLILRRTHTRLDLALAGHRLRRESDRRQATQCT